MEPTAARKEIKELIPLGEGKVTIEQELKFRKMEINDIEAIVEVENKSFATPWNQQAFIYELTQNHFAYYVVALLEEKIVGYCGMWVLIDEAHITNIAVLPEYRGRHIGEKIMRYMMVVAAVRGAERMTLEVRVSNNVAQSLYEKLGFRATGRRPKYYSDNQEDALIMWVNLNDEHSSN